MKPEDVFYNGLWYRSQLAARWAVFLDALDVGFRYEPQGFEIDSETLYWPDFWLPTLRCWLRIEETKPTGRTEAEARRLVFITREPVYVFFGLIAVPDDNTMSAYFYGPCFDNKSSDEVLVDFDEMYWWCECPFCSIVGIQYQGRAARLPCRCVARLDHSLTKEYTFDSLRLVAAYQQAQIARLGETRFHIEG